MNALHLKEIFGHYGEVLDVKHVRGTPFRGPAATIYFANEKDAETALFHLDGGQIDGNQVKVSFVLMQQQSQSGGGRKGKQRPEND